MSSSGRAFTWFATTIVVVLASIPIRNSLGPNGVEMDPTGFVSAAVALAVLSIAAVKLRRNWAPEVARSVGWVVAAAAWFTAIVADYSTETSTQMTVSLGFSVLVVAIVYAVVLRPDADKVTHAQTVAEIADAVAQRLAVGERDEGTV